MSEYLPFLPLTTWCVILKENAWQFVLVCWAMSYGSQKAAEYSIDPLVLWALPLASGERLADGSNTLNHYH